MLHPSANSAVVRCHDYSAEHAHRHDRFNSTLAGDDFGQRRLGLPGRCTSTLHHDKKASVDITK